VENALTQTEAELFMKTLILTSLMTFIIATSALAEVDLQKLESAGQYQSVAINAASAAISIQQEIKVDDLVALIGSTVHELQLDAITLEPSKQEEVQKFVATLRIESTSDFNITSILNAQPADSLFTEKSTIVFQNMQNLTRTFIQSHRRALISAKSLAVKSMQALEKLDLNEVATVYPFVTRAVQNTKRLQFIEGHSSFANLSFSKNELVGISPSETDLTIAAHEKIIAAQLAAAIMAEK
jgi:hypothetical protein